MKSSLFIAGPTATGKSAVALKIAEKIGGEIISVDSMQVYRGLDIGTAKPSAEERATVLHHLIDVMELAEPFDAAKFCELAAKAEKEIIARGRIPIFCGGTGLYFKAYLHGLGEAPPSDEKLRSELEKMPLEELLKELAAKDNFTFQQIDQKNPRRVVRAVEVIRLTGKPFSEQKTKWEKCSVISKELPKTLARSADSFVRETQTLTETRGQGCPRSEFPGVPSIQYSVFGLTRERDDLRKRIDLRVDEMFRRGLVEEVKALLSLGLEQNKTAMQAIGYRQVVEHLRGERSLEETIELVKIKTRQFAKRQMTWFRGQMDLKWISLNEKSSLDAAVEEILRESF